MDTDQMEIRDRIRKLSVLPSRFNIMLEHALLRVEEKSREHLCTVACVISNATWQHWQSWRLPEDNRQEHEWVVFANVMQIAKSEGLTLSNRRIATAFCFIHDTCSIRRIMEGDIRELPPGEAAKSKQMSSERRVAHMKGGAENAGFLLRQLKDPDTQEPLLNEREIDRCVAIVAKHDSWKLDKPKPPRTKDRLAFACLEGDVLWPLHPIGVLADLERPNDKGENKDLFDPVKWREQLESSLKTLEFKPYGTKIPARDFKHGTIFRTNEGYRLYSAWREFWHL